MMRDAAVSNVSTGLDQQITISLPKGTLLVLFEFLAHSYEEWKKADTKQSDESFALLKPDSGERIALWHLEGEIERTLPELFAPNYQDLIAEWKQKLTSSA